MGLNDYRVIKPLGEGGFGKTYLVEEIRLPGKPKRVLKHLQPHLPPNPQDQAQVWSICQRLFEKEAKMLASLGSHPQIPALHNYFNDYGNLFLIQEYIQGKSLKEEIGAGGKFSEKQTLNLLEEILEVLKFGNCFNVSRNH